LAVRDRPSFLDRTAVTGTGYTPFSKQSPKSVLGLAAEACRAALDDAGVRARDVDGVVNFSLFNDSVSSMAVATALGIPELSYQLELNLGGEAPCFAVINAAMAIDAGLARNVLVYRALKGRSGVRIGSQRFRAPSNQYRLPYGLTAYPQYIALWARRFMVETGATEEDLAAVVMAQREYASVNERAIRRRTLTVDEYMADRFVVEPFRSVDCTSEVDGACAVLVTSRDEARDHAVPAVVLKGAAWATGPQPGIDIADVAHTPDYTRNCHSYLADRLWRSAGLGPSDVDLAEIYDCFSSVVLFGLEGLGLVGRGESGAFVRSGETRLNGRLPVNTHGGLLCEGYVHGMNTVVEAVRQLQGRGGPSQVPDAKVAVVTSGALIAGSSMVLEAT
jgi:acetyl-CoA acetyltransferase